MPLFTEDESARQVDDRDRGLCELSTIETGTSRSSSTWSGPSAEDSRLEDAVLTPTRCRPGPALTRPSVWADAQKGCEAATAASPGRLRPAAADPASRCRRHPRPSSHTRSIEAGAAAHHFTSPQQPQLEDGSERQVLIKRKAIFSQTSTANAPDLRRRHRSMHEEGRCCWPRDLRLCDSEQQGRKVSAQQAYGHQRDRGSLDIRYPTGAVYVK